MQYTTLGDTGMSVSRIALGCAGFGDSAWRDWVLDEEESREIIERAVELGINYFDTSNLYSLGESERLLGDVLSQYDRDSKVIASKCYYQTDPDNPNSGGLSRKAIDQAIQNSKERLGVDTIDLYQIHRWDYDTDIKETLRAFDDAVTRGDIHNFGASSIWGYQLVEALKTSRSMNIDSFATMQNHYNLMYREEEREIMPICQQEGIAFVPWSPLARGTLARPLENLDATRRGQTDDRTEGHPYLERGGREINERVQELAEEYDASMAQISLAWMLSKDMVDVPIIGATSIKHLEEAVEAVDIDLRESDIAYLEEPYKPVRVSGKNKTA
ncbi:aldo/keto reductase [Haloarchaeobius salinus]|uniref:aldo/keto reductase n=1 Tax=Haloarchaeobius salinus TaxID=1198298 RepID=UPI0021086BA8